MSASGSSPTSFAVPHLVAAAIAGTLFIVGLVGVSWYAERLVGRRIYDLAGSRYTQKTLGIVVQREALRHADLLPLYGSSEIDDDSLYHARELFADAPTGFAVMTVAGRGTPVFETLENLGALGSDLRGKKVAISLSPPMFLIQDGALLTKRYAGNFSPLQALALMLCPDLSASLKRQLASRLLARPGLLERNRVLALTVTMVADGSAIRRPLYYAFRPLAGLQQTLLETQDKILVLGHLLSPRSETGGKPHSVRALDWPALVADATARSQPYANNPWGVADKWWQENEEWAASQRNAWTDEQFLGDMTRSESWIDLDQLLQVLSELKAQPLILSMPFDGRFWDYQGVSAAARGQYYARVRAIASRYAARTAILDDHETDPYFFFDLWSHPGPKGWVYFDKALDAFYHDALR